MTKMKSSKSKFIKCLVPILGLALVLPTASIPVSAAAGPVSAPLTVKSVEFVGMDAPATAEQMAQVYTKASVKVTYSDNTEKIFPLAYNKLFKTTDSVGGTIAGVAVDSKGKPIMDTSVPNNPQPFVSDDPDSNSLLQVQGAPATGLGGNPLSLITHYEYITHNQAGGSAYGIVPASMSHTIIDQNKTTGELTPVKLSKVDFSGVDGLWIPCNGSLTPWNTHLGSEEYEADARAFEADPKQTYVNPFVQSYYQDQSKTGNPYAYNYLTEVTVNKDNSTSVAKHYSTGRFSHELGKVAPDQRTVFFGDDGSNTMLFLYVADKAADLSSGSLYAAKWVQKSAENGGSADLEWIKLGHATDSEVKSYIDKGLKFSDIFLTSDKAADGFKAIKTYPSGKVEYLKVKPGMEQAAAFLESRRYGALLGATSEFNKMEGVTVNAKDKKTYIAMSYVEKAMEKDSKGTDPADDIQVNKISSGVTYELSLSGGQKDRDQAAIDSSYVPSFMKGLVWGEDLAQPDAKGNKAADDKVANPDNLSYSESLRTLFIGEDSGMHANNYVWAYNIDTGKLSRVLSTPAGAEATGLQFVEGLNGFNYVMSNFQHPGDEMIVADSLKASVESNINQNFNNKSAGAVGYISGVPTEQQMLAAVAKETKPEPAKPSTPSTPSTSNGHDSSKPSVTPTGLIGIRQAAKAAGISLTWNGATHEVVLVKGKHKLVIRVDAQTAVLDGQTIKLPLKTVMKKDSVHFSAAVFHQFAQLK